MEENFIKTLEKTIKDIKSLEKATNLTEEQKSRLQSSQRTAQALLDVFINENNINDAKEFIKVAPINVDLVHIVSVICDKGLMYEKKDDCVLVKFKNPNNLNNNIVIKFSVNNIWLTYQAWTENYKINNSNIKIINDFLNQYNYETRFCKAFIDKDLNIQLVRYDLKKHFWTEKDLAASISLFIELIAHFFMKYKDELSKFAD